MHDAIGIRPSGAALWSVCQGQPSLALGLPDNDCEADDTVREEGTACHMVALALAHGHAVTEGMVCPNGVAVTDEMLDASQLYLSTVRGWGCAVNYETPMHIARIHPDLQGTPDAWGYNEHTRTLHMGDLKYGYRYVEAFENLQCICYVTGAMDLLGLDDRDTWIEITIVQPRAYGHGEVRTWRTQASNLRQHVNYLSAAAHTTLSPGGKLLVNPGCINCVARFKCPALQTSAMDALSLAVQMLPLELQPGDLAAELRILQRYSKFMEARITGLESQAVQLIRGGAVVPGFELSRGTGRESWQSPEKEAEAMALARMMGQNIAKPTKAVTPTQAKKILPAELVGLYSHRLPTELKLKQVDSKSVRKAFGS